MDEDDFLGGDLEQDLHHQLQRGGGREIGVDRGGFKGRRVDNQASRGYNQEVRVQERPEGNKTFNPGRLEPA